MKTSNRRDFLKKAALAGASALVAPGLLATEEKEVIQSNSYRTFTGTAQSGKPYHHTMLTEKLFFILSRQHPIKNRIYIIVCHNLIIKRAKLME